MRLYEDLEIGYRDRIDGFMENVIYHVRVCLKAYQKSSVHMESCECNKLSIQKKYFFFYLMDLDQIH